MKTNPQALFSKDGLGKLVGSQETKDVGHGSKKYFSNWLIGNMSPILGVKVSIDFENENDHVSRESLEISMSQPATNVSTLKSTLQQTYD